MVTSTPRTWRSDAIGNKRRVTTEPMINAPPRNAVAAAVTRATDAIVKIDPPCAAAVMAPLTAPRMIRPRTSSMTAAPRMIRASRLREAPRS